MRPTFGKYGTPVLGVDQEFGETYKTIEAVAASLPEITYLAKNLSLIGTDYFDTRYIRSGQNSVKIVDGMTIAGISGKNMILADDPLTINAPRLFLPSILDISVDGETLSDALDKHIRHLADTEYLKANQTDLVLVTKNQTDLVVSVVDDTHGSIKLVKDDDTTGTELDIVAETINFSGDLKVAGKGIYEDAALTGHPTAPTPNVGVDDDSIATARFINRLVLSAGTFAPSDTAPLMNGSASAGTSGFGSRADHTHPSDNTRYAKTGGNISGNVGIGADGLPQWISGATVLDLNKVGGLYVSGSFTGLFSNGYAGTGGSYSRDAGFVSGLSFDKTTGSFAVKIADTAATAADQKQDIASFTDKLRVGKDYVWTGENVFTEGNRIVFGAVSDTQKWGSRYSAVQSLGGASLYLTGMPQMAGIVQNGYCSETAEGFDSWKSVAPGPVHSAAVTPAGFEVSGFLNPAASADQSGVLFTYLHSEYNKLFVTVPSEVNSYSQWKDGTAEIRAGVNTYLVNSSGSRSTQLTFNTFYKDDNKWYVTDGNDGTAITMQKDNITMTLVTNSDPGKAPSGEGINYDLVRLDKTKLNVLIGNVTLGSGTDPWAVTTKANDGTEDFFGFRKGITWYQAWFKDSATGKPKSLGFSSVPTYSFSAPAANGITVNYSSEYGSIKHVVGTDGSISMIFADGTGANGKFAITQDAGGRWKVGDGALHLLITSGRSEAIVRANGQSVALNGASSTNGQEVFGCAVQEEGTHRGLQAYYNNNRHWIMRVEKTDTGAPGKVIMCEGTGPLVLSQRPTGEGSEATDVTWVDAKKTEAVTEAKAYVDSKMFTTTAGGAQIITMLNGIRTVHTVWSLTNIATTGTSFTVDLSAWKFTAPPHVQLTVQSSSIGVFVKYTSVSETQLVGTAWATNAGLNATINIALVGPANA